ncbi:MAG: MBL fold metallo-hydrolase [Gemmatimonadales bacterium]
MSGLRIIRIENGAFLENCYLVHEAGAGDAVIVDPGEAADRFLAQAAHHGLTIREVWLTHAHIDHILGVGAVHQATGAPILLHPADEPLYQALPEQGALWGFAAAAPPPVTRYLAAGEELRLGDTTLTVRHTPGHSPGSVCFIAGNTVLGGDVLFQGSIGRTDLPGGDHAQLIASIERELLTLPDDVVVHPGHGPPTTIGAERRHNPFLTGIAR